ncbi:MAG TPA: response regulator [Kiritimatiellia bacterium]|nr:response regulator [Kiritimatiellia bacterium]
MKQRILVVDDDELVRSGLAADLTREGFQVRSAAGGEMALADLAKHPADLVLCDLVLGDMDGIEVLRRIKQLSHETAVVMITGHATIRNALDALRNGASDYIAKPADPEEVAHRLRTVLDAEHLRRSLAAERTRAENRKRETQDLLVRTERMASLGTLAAGAARDLQDILLPIRAHAAALRETLPLENPGLELVRAIEEAGARAEAVIDDLHAIGTAARYDTDFVSCNQLVERCLKSEEFLKLKSGLNKVRVEMKLDSALPPIRASASALERSLNHLLAHVLESIAAGGLISVETRARHIEQPVGRYGAGTPGDYVVVAVHDTGAALAGEDIERLFEPFYNRTAMGRRFVSGLGMTLVHRVVADHGGYLDVESVAGKGTTYLLHLPVSSGEAVLELKADYTGQERILVVDDYEDHRRAAGDILRDLGYHVITAPNGREAVRLFESALREEDTRIHLAVIDLVLGDEFDGVETYKKLIELQPGQPAVLVSGFADIARIVEARKLGIRQSIQKPYAADTLGAAVRAALDG